MRTIKTFAALLLTLLFLCSYGTMGVGAYAQEASNYTFKDNCDFLQDYRPIQDGLKVFCAKMENFPTAKAFNVMMAGESIPVVSLDSAAKEPVTYYCLVDVSGSINSKQLLMARQMLTGLCKALGEGDQMLIATIAKELKTSDYLTDQDKILEKIEEIHTTAEDTNLYRAIADSLEELNTNKDLKDRRKALVVFSDGIDDITADSGRTKEEAEKKIDDTRIPVYFMLPPSGEKDAGKTLGSFARRSVGGEAYFMSENKYTEEQIGQAIAEDMKGDMILRLDLTGFAPREDEFLLAVEFKDTTGTTYGDSIRIISKVLMLTPIVTPSNQPIIPPPPPVPDGPDWMLWAKIGLGVVCVAAAALICWLILKKRKEEQAPQESSELVQGEDEFRADIRDSGIGATESVQAEDNVRWGGEPLPPTRPADSLASARDGIQIRFAAVGNKSFTKDFFLQEGKEVTVGRNGRADVILNESDKRLSGVHFGITLKNNKLRVRDLGSTNGTSVNGIRLKNSGLELQSGETITAGSYQYRVLF